MRAPSSPGKLCVLLLCEVCQKVDLHMSFATDALLEHLPTHHSDHESTTTKNFSRSDLASSSTSQSTNHLK